MLLFTIEKSKPNERNIQKCTFDDKKEEHKSLFFIENYKKLF